LALVKPPNPHLDIQAPREPQGVVLVLHGGQANSHSPTSPTQLAVLRARPFASRISRLAGDKLAVARIRFTVRGWNDAEESPVHDARLALAQLSERFGDLPIALVGYSMGGRTAMRVAHHDQVTTVVGLAPWLVKGEPYGDLSGRNLLFIHGTHDRTTSWKGSRFIAAKLHAEGVNATFVQVNGEGHPMLRRPTLWHDLAAGYVVRHLTGQSVPVRVPNLMQQVLDGTAYITA
jgi:pimeloyl-ACP methyl ester carboxylesterase